jgi:hypothetical protein
MFSFGTPKTELGVIFDIGSSSVGAALTLFQKDAPARIVHTVRQPISFDDKPEPERFFQDMIAVLAQENMSVLKEGLPKLRFTEHGSLSIKHVAYVFSSPWCVSQTKMARIEKPEPFVLTRAVIEKIVDQNEKAFEAETLSADPSELSSKLAVIEKRVVHVSLNGYEVSDPYGKKARTAEISFLMSLAPKAVVDRISEVSMNSFHPRDTKMFSFPLVAFSMIRDSFHDVDDFVFLDVGGEISEISVVKRGLILETASFPAGFRSLVRKVASTFATTYAEAESLIKLSSAGDGDDTLKEKLAPVIESASREWASAFHDVLAGLSTKASLPQDLFANANSDLAHYFIFGIKREKISQFGAEEVPFSVTFISADKLKESVVFAPHAHKDLSLALAAGFFGRHGLESY